MLGRERTREWSIIFYPYGGRAGHAVPGAFAGGTAGQTCAMLSSSEERGAASSRSIRYSVCRIGPAVAAGRMIQCALYTTTIRQEVEAVQGT